MKEMTADLLWSFTSVTTQMGNNPNHNIAVPKLFIEVFLHFSQDFLDTGALQET
uniref:Uncharacterized protein n=1 Tax=Rhizophora mucronata TaxID=61149 RepID=A0A2P2N1D9_RHIMU